VGRPDGLLDNFVKLKAPRPDFFWTKSQNLEKGLMEILDKIFKINKRPHLGPDKFWIEVRLR
jgi:hypothetical protein